MAAALAPECAHCKLAIVGVQFPRGLCRACWSDVDVRLSTPVRGRPKPITSKEVRQNLVAVRDSWGLPQVREGEEPVYLQERGRLTNRDIAERAAAFLRTPGACCGRDLGDGSPDQWREEWGDIRDEANAEDEP